MPEHLRALVVILFIATFGFILSKKLVVGHVSNITFNRWRNSWFAITLAAFLTQNFWLFILVSSAAVIALTKNEPNKPALFFILLFVIPPLDEAVPGFGLINYIFTMSYPRFISLIVLLPAAIVISRKNNFKFTKIWPDKLLFLYLLVLVGLEFRDTTSTDALRKCFYIFIDIFLPYYVISRGIKNLDQMHTVLKAYFTSAIIFALIAIFESVKHWILYNSMNNALGTNDGLSKYLGRSGEVRAIATLMHPIIMGYFMAISFGLYLYLSRFIQNKTMKRVGFIVVILGLLAPLSRGPWVGAGALLVFFILQGPGAFKKLSMLAIAAIVALPMLAVLPNGQKYLDLIPFVGKTEKGNIEYREQLFKNAMIVINKSPFFGSSNYLETPEMQAMRQGGGIIDIVNSYLRVTLETGYIGLGLFVGIFLLTILSIRKSMRLIKNKNDDIHVLGRCLVAILIAIMLIIATASSIGTLPIIYWSMLALGIAYGQVVKHYVSSQPSSP